MPHNATGRPRRPCLGSYQRLVQFQQEARATGAGDEYLHLCGTGEVAAYLWQPTLTPDRFVCTGCGEVGGCVACLEDQGKTLATGVVPVLCQRHGGLDDGEGRAITVGVSRHAARRSSRLAGLAGKEVQQDRLLDVAG